MPAGISKLSNLYVFKADGNLLRGVIPDSLGQLSNPQFLSLATINLTGKLPALPSNISGPVLLLLNDNHLEEIIPTSQAAEIGRCLTYPLMNLMVPHQANCLTNPQFIG